MKEEGMRSEAKGGIRKRGKEGEERKGDNGEEEEKRRERGIGKDRKVKVRARNGK